MPLISVITLSICCFTPTGKAKAEYKAPSIEGTVGAPGNVVMCVWKAKAPKNVKIMFLKAKIL